VQLSLNLFTEITGVDLSAATSDPQADRRLHRRIAFDHRARIFPIIEGASLSGTAVLLRNISVGGVCFLYGEPIAVGDEFVIRITTANDETIDIQSAARHCEMGGTCGSQFVVGASFELVLNRPLSSSVAPESELRDEEKPLQDQPAEPTIEQRYDTQCVTSRAIRPIIRETRWDRWMAKPAVKKLSRVAYCVFWPAIIICKGINFILKASEESHIRNRLTPSKASKKWKRKNRSVAPVAQPPAVEPAPQANSAAARIEMPAPALGFAEPSASAEMPATNSAPATSAAGRKSMFASAEPEATVGPVVEKAVAPIAVATPVVVRAAAPISASVEVPVVAPVATPVVLAPTTIEPAAPSQPITPQPMMEVTPEPAHSAQVNETETALPAPSAAPMSPTTSAMQMTDQPRSMTAPDLARPPVAHPRQMRRRQRQSFHR
jgi:hypothetical protein